MKYRKSRILKDEDVDEHLKLCNLKRVAKDAGITYKHLLHLKQDVYPSSEKTYHKIKKAVQKQLDEIERTLRRNKL